jgi:CBS domain-containing protein
MSKLPIQTKHLETYAREKRESELPIGIGMITERDVVSYLGSDRALSLRTEISANSLRDAIETMQLRNIRRLPVIGGENNNNMVGIVTDKDILRAIMKIMPLPTSVGEGLLNDQMQFGYRFMYERFLNDDNFPKGIPESDEKINTYYLNSECF